MGGARETHHEEWQPQFLPSAGGTPAGVAGRTARRRPERTVSGPLMGLVVFVLVAGLLVFLIYQMGGPQAAYERLAGGFGEQFASAPPTTLAPPPTTQAPPPAEVVTDPDAVVEGEAPPPTPPGEEPPGGDPAAAAAPPPEAAPEPAPTAAPPAAATPAPAPPTTPAPPSAATASVPPSLDAARAALRGGRFDDAARGFARALGGGAPFTLQVLVACARATVEKAIQATDAPELYLLPVELQGRSCFRLCWGSYDSEQSARAGAGSVPAYFRQNGAQPRVVPIADLLP